ncbi:MULTISPECIES: transposase family protein [unclassified Streptomyces]|uniref:transposase family protein n=1 Tax=unclassified Streptomyces TaxID=2593676 RepID=UPI00403C8FBC
MPTHSSSPVPAGPDRLTTGRRAEPEEKPQLLDRLAKVPDPRTAKRRRHSLAFGRALAACAALAGTKSPTAIAEWAADAPAAVLIAPAGPSREPAGPIAPTEAGHPRDQTGQNPWPKGVEGNCQCPCRNSSVRLSVPKASVTAEGTLPGSTARCTAETHSPREISIEEPAADG